MKKITIEFQDENSTEFKVDAKSVTYRELLMLAKQLEWAQPELLPGDKTVIEIQIDGGLFVTAATESAIANWRFQLVADEFHLAAQHQFFAIQNQARAQAAQNQQALAQLQHGGRGNSGFIRGVGQG